MLRLAVAVLVAAFFVAAGGAIGQNLSSASDLAALYSLRSSLDLRARDWPRRSDPCTTWSGVGCDGAGRVVSLNLSGLRRTRIGRLNPRFAVDGLQNLTRLRSFNATGFALPGPIPDWFGGLLSPTFAVLDLRSAAVFGAIPYSLGGAVGLVVLSLAANEITGDIPPTLGQLANLSVLNLSHNALSGVVPAAFGSLSNLSQLDLSSNFLSGLMPPELGALPGLKILILANNSLNGAVPAQLGNLSSLTKLDLSFNLLAGSIPDDLKNLRSLQDLNLGNNSLSGALTDTLISGTSQLRSIKLSYNNFSGALPNSIWTLSQLQVLDVSYNNFTGTFPDLTLMIRNANASGLFDLSSNLYYGSIPFVALFGRFSTVDIYDNYFEGALPSDSSSRILSFGLNCFSNATDQRNPANCQEFYAERGLTYSGASTPRATSSSSKKSHRLTYILIGAIGGGLLVLTLLLLLVLCCICRRGRHGTEQTEISRAAVPSGGSAQGPGVSKNFSAVGQAYSYEQLVQATADFSEANLIKHGHSGDIYQGKLEDGTLVVIKRMDMQKVRKDAHLGELDLFSRGLHERLVPFLGHCLNLENEKLLVYRYVPNGDLSSVLQRKTGQEEEEGVQSLDWIKRLKIATGVAEALFYLHHVCSPPFVHRDVQSSSIFLDDKFEVRLGSLSEVSTQEGEGHKSIITRLLRLSTASEQSVSGPPAACSYDIYCFGKVLLELVTGKLGISGSNDAATNEWLEHTLPHINVHEKELVTNIVDPFLVVDEDHLEEVWAVAIVAKSCLNPKASRRPPMRYILKALENPLKVVRDDNDAGSARLRATSSRGSWNAAFMESWRHSSSNITSMPGQPRDEQMFKRSGTMGSQGSLGENSFSHKRPSNEIFPEPSGANEVED